MMKQRTKSWMLILFLTFLTSAIIPKKTKSKIQATKPNIQSQKTIVEVEIPRPPQRRPPPLPNSPEYQELKNAIINSNIFKIAQSYLSENPKKKRE